MNLTIEMAFNALMGLFVSGVCYWAKGIASRLKDSDSDRASLRMELNNIKLTYQSREDAKELNRENMEILKEIRQEIKEIGRQVSQKEDRK